MFISAVGNRILVKVIELQKKNKVAGLSGLIIPDQVKNLHAEVVGMGSEVDSSLEIGDTVVIDDRSGVPVEIDGTTYLSMIEHQILAVISED